MRVAAAMLGLVPWWGAPAAAPGGSAGEVLDRVIQTYAGCRTYQDSGVVTTVFVEKRGPRTTKRPFRTALVRPDRFRFEFRERALSEEERRYIVWRSGDEVWKWWDIKPGAVKQPSLSMGLAGATGVSGGSAQLIPALLLPEEVRGARLRNLEALTLLPEADLGGVRCLRLQGQQGPDPVTIWVDAATYLIRRVDTGHAFGDFRTETTTTYEPTLDGEVAEAALAFGVPLKAEGPAER
jgi:hypothetical protein